MHDINAKGPFLSLHLSTGMGLYVEESQHIVGMSVKNNTHIHPSNQGCDTSYCKNSSLSFCCLSNITESEVSIHYPRKGEKQQVLHRSIAYDPWEMERLQSGLCMSVGWSDYAQIASGTYSCEMSSGNVPEPVSIGIYSLYGKYSCTTSTHSMACNNMALILSMMVMDLYSTLSLFIIVFSLHIEVDGCLLH